MSHFKLKLGNSYKTKTSERVFRMFVFVENDGVLCVKMFEDIGEALPRTIIRPVKEIEGLIKIGNLIIITR